MRAGVAWEESSRATAQYGWIEVERSGDPYRIDMSRWRTRYAVNQPPHCGTVASGPALRRWREPNPNRHSARRLTAKLRRSPAVQKAGAGQCTDCCTKDLGRGPGSGYHDHVSSLRRPSEL